MRMLLICLFDLKLAAFLTASLEILEFSLVLLYTLTKFKKIADLHSPCYRCFSFCPYSKLKLNFKIFHKKMIR